MDTHHTPAIAMFSSRMESTCPANNHYNITNHVEDASCSPTRSTCNRRPPPDPDTALYSYSISRITPKWLHGLFYTKKQVNNAKCLRTCGPTIRFANSRVAIDGARFVTVPQAVITGSVEQRSLSPMMKLRRSHPDNLFLTTQYTLRCKEI